MKIQESAEDYLEAILFLGKSHEHVRSIDVVHHLGLSKPSVSVYLFMSLGVNEETAYEDACRIEHDLSDETFQALKNHYINHMSQA